MWIPLPDDIREFLSQLQFSHPWVLLFGLSLPVLWLRRQAQTLSLILWRSTIIVFLVIVLAGPELAHETSFTRREKRMFAFDLSQSMPAAVRQRFIQVARQDFSLSSEDRVFVFGGKAQEPVDWERWVQADAPTAAVQPQQTNLEALFSEVLKDSHRGRKLFLFSDGWETHGDVLRLLPLLRSSNLQVFPIVSEHHSAANVAVRKIIAPHEGVFGETIPLRVMLENDNNKPVEGNLVLKRNGKVFKSDSVTLKPGSQMLPYQITLSNDRFASFEASFVARMPAADLYPQDNRAAAWISARAREKVLLLNGQGGQGKYLEELLRRRGFEVNSVIVGEPPPLPSEYGLVIFNNVERQKLSTTYLSAVEKHTAAGNAFLMLGNEQSFGPAYKKTPIEAVLPLDLKDPPKKEEKNRAVVLVIDKSGSMREGNRILYAQEAAKSMLAQLRDRDLIGVVGFDVSAFVVVPLSQVDKVRESFSSQVDRLKPGGRTYLLPGMMEAKRQLESQSATQKHMIILSDGDTGGAQSDYIDLVNVMRRESKITVSVVAVGEDVHIPLLTRIAQYGGGFYHHTYDPRTLPKIIIQQMREPPEPERPPEEKIVSPVPVRGSQVLASFEERSYPPLRGYVETELKKGASLDLVIPRQDGRHPLLASWHYRAGKAAAFTTDLQGFWSREWVRWPDLEGFWREVFNWLKPAKEALPPHEVRINVTEDAPILDLYLYGEDNGKGFHYSYSGNGRRGDGALKRLAPGHYQATLPFTAPGDYRIDLVQERNGERRGYPTIGYTLAFDPKAEIPRRQVNLKLLEELARATGGEINPKAIAIASAETRARTATSLRPPLIALIALLFLLEIYVRRFILHLPADA
jgi:Ca-activated chloride channel family protein